MCGIVGYIGQQNGVQQVYEGLKKLEYRGYDSAGISAICGGQIKTVKCCGRVEGLNGDIVGMCGNVAIGHTRWATHGAATKQNAHPHTAGKFSVVHNGIIENWRALRSELERMGVKFTSQTDSEVVVHLLNAYYSGDFYACVKRAVGRLKGCFALGILCSDCNALCAVKYKSPVILGYGKGGMYIASDMPALSPCTDISVLEDGDIAMIEGGKVQIYNYGKNAERKVLPLNLHINGDELGSYPHYMLKEIEEEPFAIKSCIRACGSGVATALQKRLAAADNIILFGCGTAYNSTLIGKRLLGGTYAAFISCHVASQLTDDGVRLTPSTVCIAVSQSGETADTLQACQLLKDRGAYIIAITNVTYSALSRMADEVLPICAGGEVGVAATKSYICQLAAFYLLASKDIKSTKSRLYVASKRLYGTLQLKNYAQNFGKLAANSRAVFFLGRGQDYSVAVEASLKLKEVTYIFSEAYPAGELKHGTLALIDGDTLSCIIITSQKLYEKCANAIDEILARGGKVCVLTTLSTVSKRLYGKVEVATIPYCPPYMAPIVASCMLQMFAYFTAVERGINPDKPRNLAKSVTVA